MTLRRRRRSKIRSMTEKSPSRTLERRPRRPVTKEEVARRAKRYGKSVLKAISQEPENCELFDDIVHEMNNNPYLVLSGLFIEYAKEVQSIHLPKCSLNAAHKIIQ